MKPPVRSPLLSPAKDGDEDTEVLATPLKDLISLDYTEKEYKLLADDFEDNEDFKLAFIDAFISSFNPVKAYQAALEVVGAPPQRHIELRARRLLRVSSVRANLSGIIKSEVGSITPELLIYRIYQEASNPDNRDNTRLKALELLAQMGGLLANREVVSPMKTNTVPQDMTLGDLAAMTDDDLKNLYKTMKDAEEKDGAP